MVTLSIEVNHFFRKAFPEEAKKKQEKKKGQVSDETLDLMRAIKARRTEKAEQEKVKEEKEKKEKRREERERRKSDSDRKRIGSASNNPGKNFIFKLL